MRLDRAAQVQRAYRNIRALLLGCATLKESGVVLLQVNSATLNKWLTVRNRDHELAVQRRNIKLKKPAMVAKTRLPPANVRTSFCRLP